MTHPLPAGSLVTPRTPGAVAAPLSIPSNCGKPRRCYGPPLPSFIMTSPLVSVVVTNHNYGRFLGESLQSALAQEYSPVEVVVVDDGSTDESHEVLRAFSAQVTTVF